MYLEGIFIFASTLEDKVFYTSWERHSLLIKTILRSIRNYDRRTLYVLRSSGISPKSAALIVRYIQKKKYISIVLYCPVIPSIAHNLGTTGLM